MGGGGREKEGTYSLARVTRGHRKGDLEAKHLEFGLGIMVGQHLGEMSERGWAESPGRQEQNGPFGPSSLLIV